MNIFNPGCCGVKKLTSLENSKICQKKKKQKKIAIAERDHPA